MKERSKPFNRQAMFRPDGTLTDVPTELTESPTLEEQGDLMQWAKEQEKLESWNGDNG